MSTTPPKKPEPADVEAVSPDALMRDFRGRPFLKILLVTLIAHVLFIGVFSYGYLRDHLVGEPETTAGEDAAPEAERMKLAARESEAALRQIAERHGVSYSDLSARFAQASAGNATDTASSSGAPADDDNADTPESDYQKNLEQQQKPPADPDLSGGIEEEDPIFPQ